MKKDITKPPVFLKFTIYMNQDFETFESLDALLLYGLKGLTKNERTELLAFLKSILRPEVSDDLIGQLWNTSHAEFGSSDAGVRWLLQQLLDLMEKGDETRIHYKSAHGKKAQ